MLEPRKADIPALFLFLVVLPVVAYVLLGKWSETAKKKERISLLAQLAAEEACKAEVMAAVGVIPNVSSSKNVTHECALCFRPATTRCSRCKSARYCSGKCQIIHWRQGHKEECQQLETSSSSSSPKPASVEESIHERVLIPEDMNSQFFGSNTKHPAKDKAALENRFCPSITGAPASSSAIMDIPQVSMSQRRIADRWVSRKSNREMLRKEDTLFNFSEEIPRNGFPSSTSSNVIPSKESYMRHKLRNNDSIESGEISKKHNVSGPMALNQGHNGSRSSMLGSEESHSQHGSVSEIISNSGISSSLHSGKTWKNSCEVEMDFFLNEGNSLAEGITSNVEAGDLNRSSEMASTKRSVKSRGALHPPGTKISKSARTLMKTSSEQSCSEMERKSQMADESKIITMRDSTTIPAQGSNGVTGMGIIKMMGLRKSSKLSRQNASEVGWDSREKIKMLFPYEEFVQFFLSEVSDLSPRGLLNCGNSCYANAVLQCLTCTKPLAIYLLQRSHSRSCCVKNWCLMCELEQHVMMLIENGGPISPSRILSHMRNINCQIGDGSQEDAHEFLRFLVTSMQSICLEGLGGEHKVDPRLQETTFIQHTFGGRLRSKVKCLRCHHESERYENIMDLTLEILGWVESLEDALTQFTTSEDLDGENMYRCGRCASYVRARKQLSIHEAPNILTVVLKRFQEGRYGKINKCITFPDMLDMVPFMTGTDDIPPLYILYGVVVHLDTLNASFSGHYVAYVKDLQSNWFRIDDAEIQPVPMSQVMSEGAYILFYTRSCPRPPPRAFSRKPTWEQAPASATPWNSKSQKATRPGQSKTSSHSVGLAPSHAPRHGTAAGFTHHLSDRGFRSTDRSVLPVMEGRADQMSMEFSDATSSDWSLFTSSDDASFTTESTRDSFSTVDYADTGNLNPISSIFNSFYAPEYSAHGSVSCRMFSNSKPLTRFVSEERGYALDSFLSSQQQQRFCKPGHLKQVGSSTEFPSQSNCSMFVKYGSNPKDDIVQTSCNCEL
ncbi:ubiquitin carboxyl-terminal hydrolase 15 [Malania oleifera]|uniref:ubiquitin carboxyl-terminal hydrolase 15 n=1 Tax=Malania oleifera TaxID=397392 RepID=UPI0025ADDE7F|nr:ubiquitin carboxyl-terminal hydrolase 15 [Malania oleifera]XP_057949649.1 ubiquitin carboxyl-terminal hydrolase 15 [Malania oleifera]